MLIINNASFPVIAMCWHKQYGYGDQEIIEPNESENISGPFLGEMDGGECRLAMPGEISCHEDEDNENGFHVSKGSQLNLGNGDFGVIIWHYEDELVLKKE
ncbi:hypothetical protein C0583_05300 [Candidatus Parcubacteria bacterium]|nr:MAG: hypothetical protein C0583_05300 [Candidatus Parcubacteria bacterium]